MDRTRVGDADRRRGGVLLDGVLLVVALGCVAYLLVHMLVLPAAHRALRKEREAHALQREVDALAAEVAALRREVLALQSDPWYIDRTLRRKLRALRPDLFRQQGSGRAAAGGPLPAPRPPVR